MIKDFIFYWREYGFQWAWLYLQVGDQGIEGSLALIDNDCAGRTLTRNNEWTSDCDCLELI